MHPALGDLDGVEGGAFEDLVAGEEQVYSVVVGEIVAQAPDEDCVIAAELDRARLREIRTKLPSLANTRLLQQRA